MSDYNGWTNKETWLVRVHELFDSEQIKEFLEGALNDGRLNDHIIANNPQLGGVERALTLDLAEWMEEDHDQLIEELGLLPSNSYVQDQLNCAIGSINWVEIAEHYDQEIKEVLNNRDEEEE